MRSTHAEPAHSSTGAQNSNGGMAFRSNAGPKPSSAAISLPPSRKCVDGVHVQVRRSRRSPSRIRTCTDGAGFFADGHVHRVGDGHRGEPRAAALAQGRVRDGRGPRDQRGLQASAVLSGGPLNVFNTRGWRAGVRCTKTVHTHVCLYVLDRCLCGRRRGRTWDTVLYAGVARTRTRTRKIIRGPRARRTHSR